MQIAPDSVQHIHNEQTLLAFLRDDLQWKIDADADSLRDATYHWSHDDLQLDETHANIQFRQLKPFVQNQWAGIFIVKFPENSAAYKTVLRKALRTLVTKKRGGSTAKTWALENLFFICTPNYKDFTIAHYSGETPYKAKLATFAWEYQSPYLRTLCEYNLPNLALPDSLETDAWRKQWLSAFDVEKVTEKFFQDFEAAFQTLFAKRFGASDKDHRIAALTTLNRLMFLYFIQKKNWLNDDGDYLAKKLAEAKKKSLNFYSDILKRIYFEFLSVPLHERNKRHFGQSAREIHSLIGRIPFLNGGLFEPKPFDARIAFTNEEFERIFGFFQRYHFTVAENTPLDIEVAVDPEMLGKVFESLIGEERKQKGMFYTPASVVSFMCKESLLQFLRTTLPSDAQALETFVRNHDASRLKQPEAVLHALSTVKVLDPACGSGAFLLGMLHELVSLRYALFATKHIDQKTIYERKKDIIEQTLYGVDIDPFAVEMAQFRLWLSLAVDFQHKLIDEIPALPNLDFKIRTGDSLVAEYEGVSFHYDPTRAKGKKNRIESALKTIVALQHDYFNAHTANDKHTLKSKLHRELRTLAITELTAQLKSISIQESLLESDKEKKARKVKEAEIAKLNALIADLNTRDTLPDNFPLLWEVDFANIINNGGFDIVIGNPPYLRIQGIRKANSHYADLLASHFKSATGAFDLYVLFVEKGLELLNQRGILNYIMPVKWTNAAFGKGLREVVSQKSAAFKIISFEAFQVFNASTYTGLQWFKPNSPTLQYYQLDRDLPDNDALMQFLSQLRNEHFNTYKPNELLVDGWTLTDKRAEKILQKIRQQPLKVKDIFEKIFQGIATSKDSVYFILNCTDNSQVVKGFSKELEREVEIERAFVKPLLKGDQVHRYETLKTNNYVIFPYKLSNGKAVLYTEKEIKTLFPKGYAYLKENETVLRERENGRLLNDEYWFRYIYPKNLTLFDKPKLICPYLGLKGQFASDLSGQLYGNTKCFGLIKRNTIPLHYYYLLGLLNSELLWFFLKNTGTIFRGGYFAFTPDYLNDFGIAQPDLRETESRIVELVKEIIAKKARGKDTTGLEREIDLMVYGLYGLTAEEIAVVEGKA